MTVSTKKMKQKQSHFMESFAGNISHDDGYTFENNTYKSCLGYFLPISWSILCIASLKKGHKVIQMMFNLHVFIKVYMSLI